MATRFRGDIQGLRAMAVLLVVLYHSGVTVLGGGYVGVDVFFVISGFLITSHIWSEISLNGRLRFATFYARRARRILPASFAVLALTIVAMFIWIPPLQWTQTLMVAAATAAYVPNVLFWRDGTDYLAETVPSVFQHYWSLGIEEQFYLLWPVVLVAVFWITRKSIKGVIAATALLVMSSFAASVLLTPISQPFAFFMLPTRAWELGVGGALALLIGAAPRWLDRRAVGIVGWVGLAFIVVAAFSFTERTPFPGWSAIFPVIGTALVILSASGADSSWSPNALLSARPALFVGKISYSLYLIHWPLLVIPQEAVGLNDPLPVWATLGLGILALPLAWLCWKYVEEPGRTATFLADARPGRSLFAAVAASAVTVALCFGGYQAARSLPLEVAKAAPSVSIAVDPAGTAFVPSNLSPSLRDVGSDNPEIYDDGCHQDVFESDPRGCMVGDNGAAPLVALFGDSHAAQWFPALAPLAEKGVIRLQVNTKSSCASASIPEPHDDGCESWREAVISRLVKLEPEVVLLGNFAARQIEKIHIEAGGGEWGEALDRTVEQLPSSSDVLVLADTPSGLAAPSICLSTELTNATHCAFDRDSAIRDELRAAESGIGDGVIDATPLMCNDEQCPAIIGDELVYRDAHHMTATFAESLSPVLAGQLERHLSS